VTAVIALGFAGSAGAASGQVTQFRFHGTFADAIWSTGSATSSTVTSLSVSRAKQGSELIVDQFTVNMDASGAITGATDTSADVTSGFSFAIHQPLASASTSGSSLPATVCTFDASLNLIGCSPTTMDVTATWTGQGPITRGVSSDRVKTGGFSETDHFNGTDRDATAAGTVAGLTLSGSDVAFADLGVAKAATILRCIGLSC
jgi:hypothetical protein